MVAEVFLYEKVNVCERNFVSVQVCKKVDYFGRIVHLQVYCPKDKFHTNYLFMLF